MVQAEHRPDIRQHAARREKVVAKIIALNGTVQCTEYILYSLVCNDAGLHYFRKAWKRGKAV